MTQGQVLQFVKNTVRKSFLKLPIQARAAVSSNLLCPLLANGVAPPRGFYSTIEEWQCSQAGKKFASQLQFHPAHPEETLIRKPPTHLYPELHEKFVCELRKESPATFVLEYLNGRCWGPAGSIVTPDNRLLADMSHEFQPEISRYEVFRHTYLQSPRHLPGTAIVLAAPAGAVFGHFLFDVLPRLGILEKAGFDWRQADHVVITGRYRGFQEEALQLLGIDAAKIVDCSDFPHWTADRLLVPSRPGISGNYPAWTIDFVQKLLAPYRGQVPAGISKRLLVSRSRAAGRRIANEREIFQQLALLGFTLLHNEELTMPETIAAYQQAEFVIGPMGSSMCSTLFCKPGTKVIEAYPDSSVNVFTWAFGQYLGTDFGYLVGDSLKDNQRNCHDWDYIVQIDQLTKLVEFMNLDEVA